MEKIKIISLVELEKKIDIPLTNMAISMVDSAVDKISHIRTLKNNSAYTTEYLALEKVCDLFSKALLIKNAFEIDRIELINDDLVNSKSELQRKLGAIATKLIIPESFFTDDMANDILTTINNSRHNIDQLISVKEQRDLIIKALVDEYDVLESTAKLRLKKVNLKKYSSFEAELLSEFYHEYELYYEDEEQLSKNKLKSKN